MILEPWAWTDPQLTWVLKELSAREPIFHRPEFGTSRADFENSTVAGFWEVGASGRRYSRHYVLDQLGARHAAQHEDVWETRDFHCQRLADEVYLLTYTLLQDRTRADTALYHLAEHGGRLENHLSPGNDCAGRSGMNPDLLIESGYEARRDGRLPDALRYFAEAVSSCRMEHNHEALARSLTGLGQIERDLGNRDAAIRHYEEAVALYRDLHLPLRLAHTLRHVGDILRNNGSLEQARHYYEEALALYRDDDTRPDLDLANALRGFALLNEDSGKVEAAIALWKEAKDLYKAVEVQPGIDESGAHLKSLMRT